MKTKKFSNLQLKKKKKEILLIDHKSNLQT